MIQMRENKMENLLHVGNKVDKETSNNLKDIIKEIFEVGQKTAMDQSTIVEAIKMIGNISKIENVMITDSVFKGDKVVNMDSEPTKDQ